MPPSATTSSSAILRRARSPEQKHERSVHLLDTARALLEGEHDVRDLGLNELARRAEMTKSNVYRYFESREAVLLALLLQELELWRDELVARMARRTRRRPTASDVAAAFCETVAQRTLLCRLCSALPSIIEHNAAPQRILEFKRRSLTVLSALAQAFHRAVPEIPEAQFVEFVRLAIALLIGLWPLSHPSAAAAQVLRQAELAPLRYEFERDLARGLLLVLRGMTMRAA